MAITAQRNSVFVKEPCVVCGVWDRPGEVAFFGPQGWYCDQCIGEGEARIRLGLLDRAAALRKEAAELEELAGGEITMPDEEGVRALREEVEREWEAYRREDENRINGLRVTDVGKGA